MQIDAKLEVRHPYVGEVPAELMSGLEVFKIDPEWQWVAVVEGRVVAQLLAVNAHGVLLMLRLTALPDAPKTWAVNLFREVMREARAMGCIGFTTFLSDSRPHEIKLMKIVQRLGGYLEPVSGAWVAGSTEISY